MDLIMKRADKGGFGMAPEAKTTVSDTAPSTATDSARDAGVGGDASATIQWSSKNFEDKVAPDTHVYDTYYGPQVSLSWSSSDKNIEYNKIALVMVDGLKGDDSDYKSLSGYEYDFDNHGEEGDGGSSGTPDFFQSLDKTGGADMEIAMFGDKVIPFEKIYSIQLDWTDSDSDTGGKSWSPWFSVVDGQQTSTRVQAAQAMQKKLDDAGEDKTQGFEETDSSKTSPSIVTTTDSAGNDVTLTGTNTASIHASNNSGKGGLSAGAIAGIAVGGFVFLCLIGVLVWFLMRRRRKNKARAGAYAGDASNTYIADKTDEAVVTADPQSPHSPYSDDGQNQHAAMDPNAHQYDNTHTDNAAAAWSRDGSHEQSRGIHDPDSPIGANSTQASEGGNYRHLVEEGMSAEDIRRLEEEERQLDDAIERAGRR